MLGLIGLVGDASGANNLVTCTEIVDKRGDCGGIWFTVETVANAGVKVVVKK